MKADMSRRSGAIPLLLLAGGGVLVLVFGSPGQGPGAPEAPIRPVGPATLTRPGTRSAGPEHARAPLPTAAPKNDGDFSRPVPSGIPSRIDGPDAPARRRVVGGRPADAATARRLADEFRALAGTTSDPVRRRAAGRAAERYTGIEGRETDR